MPKNVRYAFVFGNMVLPTIVAAWFLFFAGPIGRLITGYQESGMIVAGVGVWILVRTTRIIESNMPEFDVPAQQPEKKKE